MANSDDDRDGRNPITRGYVLATRAMSAGMQLAIPPLIGWWADGKFHTRPWCLLLGAVLGFCTSLLEIMRLAKSGGNSRGGRE